MNEQKQPAVAGPVEPTVRPGLPVIGCVWGGMVWLVSLRSPKKLDLGARLYSEAELDAAVAAERERWRSAVLEMRGRLLWLDQRADTRDIDALLEGPNSSMVQP